MNKSKYCLKYPISFFNIDFEDLIAKNAEKKHIVLYPTYRCEQFFSFNQFSTIWISNI